MSNKVYVDITLDKPRKLLFTLNSIADFEKSTGKNFFDLSGNMSVTDLRALFWACLRHEEPALTIETVGDLIGLNNLVTVKDALLRAQRLNSPDETPKGGPSPLAESPQS